MVTERGYRSVNPIVEDVEMAKRKDISPDNTDANASSDTAPVAATDKNDSSAEIKTETAAPKPSESGATEAPAISIEPPSASADTAKPADADDAGDADVAKPPPAATSSPHRFLQLAAAVAIAAALGAVLGSLGSAGVASLRPQSSANAAASSNALAEESRALRQLTAKLAADVKTLKQSIATANRGTNSQFAKLAERLEQARSEPAAKLARIGEALARLEQRVATETTGSITTRQAVPTPPLPPVKPAIASGWVLREVFDGRALVENHHEIYEIRPGSKLPELGRVEKIRRQNGRWVVVTAKGLIVSAR